MRGIKPLENLLSLTSCNSSGTVEKAIEMCVLVVCVGLANCCRGVPVKLAPQGRDYFLIQTCQYKTK